MFSTDPVERRLNSQAAAHISWARTPDPARRTAPARAAMLAKFEREADPEGVLAPQERARRAEHLRIAYFQRMALRSAQTRRLRKLGGQR